MTVLESAKGVSPAWSITLADSIRELSALAHLRFNQALMQLIGLATSGHEMQAHLQRHALFIQAGDLAAVATSFNNVLEAANRQEEGAPLLAAVLAPLVRAIGGVAYADLTPDGLTKTAWAVLATGIGQVELEAAVEQSKKNCTPN